MKKSRAKKCLSKLVNLNRKSIDHTIRCREKILKGEILSLIHTKRKIRHDMLSEKDAKVVYDYWSIVASRPTVNKKDTLKKRVGKKEYLHHARHVLEKTQTEAYLEFCNLHPEINSNRQSLKMSSRPESEVGGHACVVSMWKQKSFSLTA